MRHGAQGLYREGALLLSVPIHSWAVPSKDNATKTIVEEKRVSPIIVAKQESIKKEL